MGAGKSKTAMNEPEEASMPVSRKSGARRSASAPEETEPSPRQNGAGSAAGAAEPCREEETALAAATARVEAENARLEAQLQRVQLQNTALDALVREQEESLAEVRGFIGRLEERRCDWRRRYALLTGQPLDEPTATRRAPG